MRESLLFFRFDGSVCVFKYRNINLGILVSTEWAELGSNTIYTFQRFKTDICVWVFTQENRSLWTQTDTTALQNKVLRQLPSCSKNLNVGDRKLSFVNLGTGVLSPILFQDVEFTGLNGTIWWRNQTPEWLQFVELDGDVYPAVYDSKPGRDEEDDGTTSGQVTSVENLEGSSWQKPKPSPLKNVTP